MTLKTAVKNSVVLRIKYYPNIDGQSRTGWRTVLPLDLYSYRGVQYCLCWFTEGSSVTGGAGYRLFITKNIKEMEEVDTTKQQPFALKLNQKMNNALLKVHAWYMVKTGKIE